MKDKITKMFKKERTLVILSIIVIFSALMFSNIGDDKAIDSQNQTIETKRAEVKSIICDGISITENCELDGIHYLKYKYYPAIEEVSHTETKMTYTREIVGYCTLCNDGTRSPSCSTGSGTCSHHGGVAEWNSPIYRDVPHYEQIKIIDSPAVEERYEKIIK